VTVLLDAPSSEGEDRSPRYDASPEAYTRLRRSVIAAGLLDRRYGYYVGRTVVSFAFLAAALALYAILPVTLLSGAAVAIALGFAFAQVAMIGHDCGHHAVFRRARPNWVLGQICFNLVMGISFFSWRDRHNRHHVETNDEEDDPDLSFGGFFTLNEAEAASRRGLSRLVVRYQAWLFVPVLALALSLVMRGAGWHYVLTKLRGPRRLAEIGLMTVSALIWLLPTVLLGWGWLAVYLGSQAVGGLYLGMIIAPNHKGMPTWAAGLPLTFLERQVLSSRNVLPGRVTDFLFGGLNYQIEHHLFPTIPRVNLGRARAIVKPFCLAHGLPYEEVGALTSYRRTFAAFDACGRATSR
jgi:fatty acid desaturase